MAATKTLSQYLVDAQPWPSSSVLVFERLLICLVALTRFDTCLSQNLYLSMRWFKRASWCFLSLKTSLSWREQNSKNLFQISELETCQLKTKIFKNLLAKKSYKKSNNISILIIYLRQFVAIHANCKGYSVYYCWMHLSGSASSEKREVQRDRLRVSCQTLKVGRLGPHAALCSSEYSEIKSFYFNPFS